ncbi:hypothetical protein [Peterkaempfera bronchialis]|uniref:Transmembrane protein n=1 Tax=Peterkaempfera bronchialis TaxID=2126346 RepID=A0A345SY71_9ACTN|nr:hypothetical protein [Peterkaempfera bronchialis]AXI78676.1 hypothetical protein C7M71_015820 [Peterkaempfera bronchialis]
MNTAPHLRPEDRPDFERALDEALRADAVRRALQAPGAGLNAEQLRTRALAAIGVIAAEAAGEYGYYTALHDRVRESAPLQDGRQGSNPGTTGGLSAGAVPVMIVLAPILAWAAALILLLLGYGLRATEPHLEFAHSLVTAGWVSLAVGAVALVGGIIGLLLTALRDGSAPPDGQDPEIYAELATAKDTWKAALRDRGILPFLLAALPAATAAEPTERAVAAAGGGVSLVRRPDLGYTSPGFTSPGPEPTPRRDHGSRPASFSSPDYSGPGYSGPGYSSPDFTSPNYDGPDQPRP